MTFKKIIKRAVFIILGLIGLVYALVYGYIWYCNHWL